MALSGVASTSTVNVEGIDMTGPHSTFRIYQAELSSFCNMKCTYCPHPTMKRAKGYMSASVLDAIISHLKATGQLQLVLHH